MANSSGEHVELECAFDGNPRPAVTWTKDDVIVSDRAVLAFAAVEQSDAGRYVCRARSELGSASGSIDLAIRGPPVITSAKEQFGSLLQCAFTAEPAAQMVKVIDLSRDDSSAIIHESFSHNTTIVELDITVGQYECQVSNELGMASTIIRIQPEGNENFSKMHFKSFPYFGFRIISTTN